MKHKITWDEYRWLLRHDLKRIKQMMRDGGFKIVLENGKERIHKYAWHHKEEKDVGVEGSPSWTSYLLSRKGDFPD